MTEWLENIPDPEEWVAEKLLSAPDGVLSRQELRDAAALLVPGQRRNSSGHAGSGRYSGTRSSRYVYSGVKILDREGLVVRSGEYVVIADRPGLLAWLQDDEEKDPVTSGSPIPPQGA